MKGRSNLGYKILFFVVLAAVIINAAARSYRPFYFDFVPAPDTTAAQRDSLAKADSARKLHWPLHDKTGDPMTDYKRPGSIDLKDPSNESKEFVYNPDSNRYDYNNRLGGDFLRNPTYMTLDEYTRYRGRQDEDAYWRRRLDNLMQFNKTPELPQMYKEGLFDRIFGGSSIMVRPQGNVDVTFGGNWQNIQNPTLTRRAQKYGVFDFNMDMNINLLATVGDKLKLNISNNTKATFDYQNVQKLDYNGKEDEMLKKIEAGNVSFPLKSNLISGVQSLFGLKTQLQFGKLWVTAVLSQQKSQRKSLTVQGGAQSQQIAIKADNYEENKDFLMSQFFFKNYDKALENFPIINSLVTINKVEVWVTNRTGAVTGVRNLLCFMDLGEADPYLPILANGASGVPNGLPDNSANRLYSQLVQNPIGRLQASAASAARGLSLTPGQDFEATTARQLSPSEFTFNPQLGYIMLNTQLNTDDVLGIAFRYTYRGKVYQVGEFASDLPPSTDSNSKVLFLKLLKGTSARPRLPVWNLMMKNVYALGGLGVSKENFVLNILYQDPGGGEKRYMPEGPKQGTPFLSLLNLDRLNAQNEARPDGIFDFVEGITINTQQGKIIFPVLQPFGHALDSAVTTNPPNLALPRKYQYQVLYDSTKTVALQSQQNDRYILRGSYKSSSSSEIFLGGFNIPPGSVSVSAGGTRLVENQDYQIDYGLGKIKILNTGILNSGVPINIQYEDNATFGFQQQNFMATRFDYYLNKNLTLGATVMRLNERPFTQQVSYGDDPIKNLVLGVDANYQTEFPALTRALDKLPIYSTTATSFLNGNMEVAAMLPGHPKQIDALDPEGSVYIDNFEGTTNTYDLKFPAQSWSLSATPFGAVNRNGQTLFPEAANDDLTNSVNRAKLAWYTIEPTLVDPGGSAPGYVKNEPLQHYVRIVSTQDVFPNKPITTGYANVLSTFDLGYYPNQRGPYNFDASGVNNDGTLTNASGRWGGIMRPIDNTDFEASNVEYIQFWLMDPFINNPTSQGGSLYLNLGDVSEDVLKDSRMFFENGVPAPLDVTKLENSVWGYVPKFSQQITRSFDNNPGSRAIQDVGYDGLPDNGAAAGDIGEHNKFDAFLTQLRQKLGANNPAYLEADADPANDNYHFYRGSDYDQANGNVGLGVLARYKKFNNPQGNSPVTSATASYPTSATTLPESEDINRDNTLTEAESYFQYRLDLKPNMQVGTNNIISIQTARVRLPNGATENENWYQFKIPIREYDHNVGGRGDFRSIRFMRMFMSGWQDSVIMRFASLELGRNQWRTYRYSLNTPGENLPQQNQSLTDFTVTSVSVEENGRREPIPYMLPPGVNRQLTTTQSNQTQQLNEQSLSLRVCALQDGDARAVFKEVNVDMRMFTYLRMFVHAESMVGQAPVRNADVAAFMRIGSDFTNNYYEYRTPLTITQPGGPMNQEQIWPASNAMNLVLTDLVNAKKERDEKGWAPFIPYETKDSKGNTIIVLGNPNIGGAKNIMLGLINPKKSNSTPGDDGLPKCIEVWFDEMRMAGIYDRAGYAAAGKVSVQLADLGNVNLSGSMHTPGYGNIDQKIDQRAQDQYYQYNASTNLSLGKMLPRSWGVQIPFFVGYTQAVSTPKWDPYNQDVKLEDELNSAKNRGKRDSIKDVAQDFTSITSINFTNVRIQGDPSAPQKTRMPWSVKNFDLSYSYNEQYKHNPLIANDDLVTHKGGLGYIYSLKTKPIEPFKKMIKSKSKWMTLVKDINLTPLPSTFSMRNDLGRLTEETQARVIDDGSGYKLEPTFYKNFTWTRLYTLRWELTRSLSFDYSATNISRIDEPYGRIDTKEKKDSLWRQISRFGHNTSYMQTFNSSYNVPLGKIPLTDWMSCRLGYTATYSWTTAPPIAYLQGNTIGNTVNKTLTGEMNMTQLYNKSRWLKAAMGPAPKKAGKGIQQQQPDGKGSVQDLRKSKSAADEKSGDKKDDKGDKNSKDNKDGKDDKKDDKKEEPRNKKEEKDAEQTKSLTKMFPGLDVSKLSDKQMDSLVKVMKEKDRLAEKAAKKKKKADKKAAKKARKAKAMSVSTTERIIGHIITMVNRVTINYTQSGGTILPGYMDSTRFLGVNSYNMAPGLGFVYGYQPNQAWFDQQANAERMSRDELFNGQLQQTYSRNLTATAAVVPFKDFRIDLNLTSTFSKSHSELFADTTGPLSKDKFNHLTPYETGAFNVTSVNVKTIFQKAGANSDAFKNFLNGRPVVSARLGASNPYTNNQPDPQNPAYKKGYGEFSQDVLIPTFLAAYAGKDVSTAPLIDYSGTGRLSDNPFKYFYPLPNWRVSYLGLGRLPMFAKIFTNFVVNHSYTGTTSMNSFNSNLLFNDFLNLGFPSFIDSNSRNYIPFFQVPNITISQAFSPLIGFDVSMKNNLTAKFELRKNKMASLSLIDYQISENESTEYVIGFGYRKKGVKLPFKVLGVQRLKNELIFKTDIGLRDDIYTNTFLANSISITSRGQKVLRISPSIDYSVSQKLTLHFYYDRQQTIPYVSNSYPMTTTRAGVTLRFIFAQ